MRSDVIYSSCSSVTRLHMLSLWGSFSLFELEHPRLTGVHFPSMNFRDIQID